MPWSTFCRAAIAAAWLFALGVCLMGGFGARERLADMARRAEHPHHLLEPR